ncbi:hypothetical protein DIURU_002152 [Diutina rugosa]|uniref:Uncharacterized protein n=1 Tax=Diutina rugosa TaxID=5481 RepID=A0A642UR33_DIURU|nr:uncharacterized protein DIURU_002152 [Diutina rugosa]KAA8903930.1 hypothetical protein DIURU_002152 [Diutina rugosa]
MSSSNHPASSGNADATKKPHSSLGDKVFGRDQNPDDVNWEAEGASFGNGVHGGGMVGGTVAEIHSHQDQAHHRVEEHHHHHTKIGEKIDKILHHHDHGDHKHKSEVKEPEPTIPQMGPVYQAQMNNLR